MVSSRRDDAEDATSDSDRARVKLRRRVSVQIAMTWRSAALGSMLCVAAKAHAQPRTSAYSDADSAVVFDAAVDWVLESDSISIPVGRSPFLFVRIGEMPKGAWAASSVARLRAHHWSFHGWALDSMHVLFDRRKLPGSGVFAAFPLELRITVEFRSDTAHVTEWWDFQTCIPPGPGMRGIDMHRHLSVRSASGWTPIGGGASGTVDILCG
jgi:hypothetical protein